MLTPSEAVARILDALSDVAPLPPERVPLAAAAGRALSEDVRADRPLPPFDNSQMDGYALRAADAPRAGHRLPVAFEVFAGDDAARPLPPGACARVFTGAPVPPGADCVEMQEEVERKGRTARFLRAAEPGRFVRPAGADVAAGSVALPAGLEVDAGAIGLAAALGLPELPVHRRPRVGILATGDEIVPLGGHPRPGQIFESNGHQLAAACAEAGADPVRLPLARDDRDSLRRSLAAARDLDALVCIGGVSVGDRDLVRAGLTGSGARLDFWRVAMRPGKPVAFGRWGRMAVFGLPGNPASSLVTFELFVRPALRALAGLPGTGRIVLRARLSAAEEKPAGLTLYLRCRLRRDGDSLWVDGLRTQQSGHLTSVVGVEGLAVLPAGPARLPRGKWVDVHLIRAPAS
ncbi:MAG TPA: gephyrin-like molybdotransferase Glp [Anaeromyxobacteraceae bacterium]|nr:gephyrin-like molybdotransferase Glp [Anaeromyxobacteraceae bacterium]